MLCTRRSFLAAGLAVPFSNRLLAQTTESNQPYADKALAHRWLLQWMESPQAATQPLHLGRFADSMYFLIKEIDWKPNPGQESLRVRVPVGFVTDFASIPRVFWTVLQPDGRYTYPAIIHSYLYWEQSTSRGRADVIFKSAMEDFRIDTVAHNTIYEGVVTGGGVAWSGNAALKRVGEKRILKEWPTDPTIRWSDWKKRPGVF